MPVTRKQIGDLLVDNGVITPEELDLAQAEHVSTGESIATVLRRLGLAGDSQLKNTLELEFGVNFVALSKFTLDYALLKMVPLEVVRDHMLVPISHEGNRLTLAMVDPSDSAALDSLQSSLNGLQIKPVVCLEEDFMQFIPDSHKPPPEALEKEVKSNGSDVGERTLDGSNGAKPHDSQTRPKPEPNPAEAQVKLQPSLDSAKASATDTSSTASSESNSPIATLNTATTEASQTTAPVAQTELCDESEPEEEEDIAPREAFIGHPPQMGDEIEKAISSADSGAAADNLSEGAAATAQAEEENSAALVGQGIYAAHGDTDGALLSTALSPEHSLATDTWSGGLSSMATDISIGHGTLSEGEEDEEGEFISEVETETSEIASLSEEHGAAMDFSVSPDSASHDDSQASSTSEVQDDIPHAATLSLKRAEAGSALHAAANDSKASIIDTGSFPAIKDIRNKYEKEESDTGSFPTLSAEEPEADNETESNAHSPNLDQLEVELARRAQEEAIVLLANQILGSAIKRQCSNIHISPGERQAVVQYRLNGVLYVDRRLPTTILEALIARYKMMARMSLSERQMPQDGHIKVKSASKEIVCLLSTVPSSSGEHIVIWIV